MIALAGVAASGNAIVKSPFVAVFAPPKSKTTTNLFCVPSTVDGVANRLVVVLDFGGDKTATNGDFTIVFPDASTPANAIISMS